MPPPQGQQQTSTAEIDPPQVTEPIQQLHYPALFQRPLQAQQRLAAPGTGPGQICADANREGMGRINHPAKASTVVQNSLDGFLSLE